MARKLTESEDRAVYKALLQTPVAQDHETNLLNVLWADMRQWRDTELIHSAELQEMLRQHLPGRLAR